MWLSFDAWVWWADALFWYAALPIILAVFVLELWLTKLRAARYKAALKTISDGNFEVEYNNVRAQRDSFVKLARETIYGHW